MHRAAPNALVTGLRVLDIWLWRWRPATAGRRALKRALQLDARLMTQSLLSTTLASAREALLQTVRVRAQSRGGRGVCSFCNATYDRVGNSPIQSAGLFPTLTYDVWPCDSNHFFKA